jgi:23S rRNA (cytosine1962-C5)-methyltransferase
VWRDQVAQADNGLAAGDVVSVRGPDGEDLGQGLWDQPSPIAIRIYAVAGMPPLDAAAMMKALESAFARRRDGVSAPETTAYRLCHGEGDRVPGLVIDRYDHVAVLRLDGGAMPRWLDRLAPGLWSLLQPMGIRSLALRGEAADGSRLKLLRGQDPPDTLEVREHGMAMVVDLARGQKTGAFLDQRENRRRVRALAQGRRTLNLFSYAGGFSTAAALGGATHVTSVDIAAEAHATAQRSFRANGIDPAHHDFVTADAFVFLAPNGKLERRWDLIVSDPPSFAPSEKARVRALGAYRKLHAACAAVLSPGGIFCAASCSSHVTAEDFTSTLDDGALGRGDLSLVEMFGPPADHPTLAGWPEGRYLKFAVLR